MSFFGIGNDSAESEDYAAPIPNQQQQQQQPTGGRPVFQTYQPPPQQPTMRTPQMQQDKMAPTTEQFHRAIFAATVRFTPRDLFALDKQGRPSTLLNDGKILLSTENGTLTRIWCDHEKDFEASDRARRERLEANVLQAQQPLPLTHHKRRQNRGAEGPLPGDGNDMAMQRDHYSDITQAIYMKHVTSTWNRAMKVEFPSVKKYKDEGYAGTNVGVFFIPNKLSATEGKNFSACQRVITNGNVKFSKDYPTTTLASLDKDISRVRDKAYIDFSSAFFSIYNSKKWGNQPYLQATHKEQNQVMMDWDHAEKWMGIVKNEIADYMCHGNITKNFQVELSVPMPHYRELDHKLFLQGNPNGWQFQGFADKDYIFQGQDVSKIGDEYLDKAFEFNAEFHVSYLPGQH